MTTESKRALTGGLIGASVAAVAGLLLMVVSATVSSGRTDEMAPAAPKAAVETDQLDTTAALAATDWQRQLARVDEALAAGNASVAIYEWREAYGAALRSRRWQSLAAVGDAGARIEELMGSTGRYRPETRQAYLSALFRARAAGSAEGIQRAAAGFEALGDQDAADLARRMPRGG